MKNFSIYVVPSPPSPRCFAALSLIPFQLLPVQSGSFLRFWLLMRGLVVCSLSRSCRHFKRLLMLTLEAAVLHVGEGEAE